MKKNILLAVCFLMPLATMAQNDTLGHERNITLSEAIVLARTQSVDAAVALNELKTIFIFPVDNILFSYQIHRSN